MPAPSHPVTIRSRFNRVLAVLFWVVAGIVVAGTVSTARSAESFDIVPLVLWIAAAAYYLLWRPALDIDENELTITNVVSRVSIPWAALIHVDTKYSLSLHVPGRAFSVWCAPAPGSTGSLRASRESRRGTAPSGTALRPGDLSTTESGHAASIVRERWERLRESGRLSGGDAARAEVRVARDIPALTVLTVGLVGALAILALV